MRAEVGYAPPFHKGVETLMNVGDLDVVDCSSGRVRCVTDIAAMAAAAAWGLAHGAGRDREARYAMFATLGFVGISVVSRLR